MPRRPTLEAAALSVVFTELLEQAGGGMGLFQALQILTFFLFLVWVPFHPKALPPVSITPGPNRGPHQCLCFRHPQWQLLDPNATATNWSEADTELCVDSWAYDRSTFTSPNVTEWDLVCDHQGLKPLGQSICMAGAMVGCIVCGFLSHRILLTSAIFMVEWTTTSTRAVTMAILGSTYSICQMAVGGLAFTLQDWRTLQLTVSVPFFVVFPISWIIAEGFLHSAAQLGSVMGPLTRMTSQLLPLLPPLSYGVIPSAAGLMVLFLPETRGLLLPDTIQDLERHRCISDPSQIKFPVCLSPSGGS
ncbi:hypothetical protein MJT46_016585 [Ovis ammon polii x Ovis aries]|nr:hypothetical protein MJT46_016585 [Ovis ammon polii x Ovis aries]